LYASCGLHHEVLANIDDDIRLTQPPALDEYRGGWKIAASASCPALVCRFDGLYFVRRDAHHWQAPSADQQTAAFCAQYGFTMALAHSLADL
jgi:hypothetical protein